MGDPIFDILKIFVQKQSLAPVPGEIKGPPEEGRGKLCALDHVYLSLLESLILGHGFEIFVEIFHQPGRG